MAKVLNIQQEITEGLKDLLHYLLQAKKVRAVLSLTKENSSESVNYSLISDPEKLQDAVPLYPLMPNNAAKLLSRLTIREALKEPIAAMLRPCELRAFVELVKRQQGSLENVVTISSICSGVYPIKMFTEGKVDNLLADYWSAASKGEQIDGIRETCSSCEYFIPQNADLIVASANEDTTCTIFLNTEKGMEMTEGFQGEPGEAELETERIRQLRKFRKKEREQLVQEMTELFSGLEGIVDVFAPCISCHGCRSICPICYCRLCEFDSRLNEYTPLNYETELHKRGGVRVPPNTATFHIGRLVHMGISCVGCGMCSDVCPVDIPVSKVFKKVGEATQHMFDYLPGRDVEESIPLTTFEEQELAEVED
jgi:formate dehydrogenase subunit beta